MMDVYRKISRMNDPSYEMCKECVGTSIVEIGFAAVKEVCVHCDGSGFIKKVKKDEV